jgi:hypothetical protein
MAWGCMISKDRRSIWRHASIRKVVHLLERLYPRFALADPKKTGSVAGTECRMISVVAGVASCLNYRALRRHIAGQCEHALGAQMNCAMVWAPAGVDRGAGRAPLRLRHTKASWLIAGADGCLLHGHRGSGSDLSFARRPSS